MIFFFFFLHLHLFSCPPSNVVLGPSQSLRYHNLNPNYIHDRLKLLGQTFTLRVLLVQVDVVSLQKSQCLL